MNFARRLGLALGILGVVGIGIGYLAAGATPAHGTSGMRWESAMQCKACHEEVYAEWKSSHHGIAYTNPEVRQLSDDFRKEECMDCHLPRPLAITGFGKRTLPRRTHFDEGVSCISCHLGPDGGIVGANDRPEVPCKPKRSADFLGVDACMSCHNQHGTTDQWRASSYAEQGIGCSNCHMPEAGRKRPDGTARRGRRHVFEGAHDKPTLLSAGKFTAERRGDQLVLALANTGAGHNFPTEERHRAVDLEYQFFDTAGKEIAGAGGGGAAGWSRAFRFRQPYRDEPGENTQLPAGKTRTVEIPIPATARSALVRCWYRLTPFCDDADQRSTLLHEQRLEWQ